MSFKNKGLSWKSQAEFAEWLKTQSVDRNIDKIVMHHTAFPDLDMRPNGLSDQHIENIVYGYEHDNGWDVGPHFFVDDYRVMGMTPIQEQGIHANSLNRGSIGIEVLGDYDDEDPYSGRGLKAWSNAAWAVKAILERFGDLTIFGHRDAPDTSKTCPGLKLDLDWFRKKVKSVNAETAEEAKLPDPPSPSLIERLNNIRWQVDQIQKEHGN